MGSEVQNDLVICPKSPAGWLAGSHKVRPNLGSRIPSLWPNRGAGQGARGEAVSQGASELCDSKAKDPTVRRVVGSLSPSQGWCLLGGRGCSVEVPPQPSRQRRRPRRKGRGWASLPGQGCRTDPPAVRAVLLRPGGSCPAGLLDAGPQTTRVRAAPSPAGVVRFLTKFHSSVWPHLGLSCGPRGPCSTRWRQPLASGADTQSPSFPEPPGAWRKPEVTPRKGRLNQEASNTGQGPGSPPPSPPSAFHPPPSALILRPTAS